MHAVKAYLGTGVFAMGACMRDTGMLLGPLLLILMATINALCQHILVSKPSKETKKKHFLILRFGQVS